MESERSRGCILIVDDSMASLALTKRMLEREGFQVLTAQDPYEAFTELRATIGVGCILTDLNMPRMDGVEFTRIASHMVDDDVPIFLLTVEDSERVRKEAMSAGARDLFTKPLMPNALGKLIDSVLPNNSVELLQDVGSTDLIFALLRTIPDLVFHVGYDGRYRAVGGPSRTQEALTAELLKSDSFVGDALTGAVGGELHAAVKRSIDEGRCVRTEFVWSSEEERRFEARCTPLKQRGALLLLRELVACQRSSHDVESLEAQTGG